MGVSCKKMSAHPQIVQVPNKDAGMCPDTSSVCTGQHHECLLCTASCMGEFQSLPPTINPQQPTPQYTPMAVWWTGRCAPAEPTPENETGGLRSSSSLNPPSLLALRAMHTLGNLSCPVILFSQFCILDLGWEARTHTCALEMHTCHPETGLPNVETTNAAKSISISLPGTPNKSQSTQIVDQRCPTKPGNQLVQLEKMRIAPYVLFSQKQRSVPHRETYHQGHV